MARSRNRGCRSGPIALLLFVPSHFHRKKYCLRLKKKKYWKLTDGKIWRVRHAYLWVRGCCSVELIGRASILKTYLLVSSTTVASINSVDLSLTITWQSSASGDLIFSVFCVTGGEKWKAINNIVISSLSYHKKTTLSSELYRCCNKMRNLINVEIEIYCLRMQFDG